MANLQELDLTGNTLGNAGIQALASSRYLGGLVTLTLDENRIGPPGIRSLAEARQLDHLRRLSLATNELAGEGLAALAGGRVVAGLHTLDVSRNRISPNGVQALAAHPSLVLRADPEQQRGGRSRTQALAGHIFLQPHRPRTRCESHRDDGAPPWATRRVLWG
jgi:hypothetical protein